MASFNIPFEKYQATGNDFVMVDNRTLGLPRRHDALYAHLCHRRFGIGADGVILIQHHAGTDFEMVYFNSDGRPSSFCGNGGRCAVVFAQSLGLVKDNSATFTAYDGTHNALIDADGTVCLKMALHGAVKQYGAHEYFLDTGSPHHVQFIDSEVAGLDVVTKGRAIRNDARYAPDGTNANFVQVTAGTLHVRTYERGVEDETYSCGTGVTAAAIAYAHQTLKTDTWDVAVHTPGGHLHVQRDADGKIWLVGPAVKVFAGTASAAL
jgi:diaminopimelate epimerase